MEVTCSKCSRKIESENVNVSKDTAYCLSCKNLSSLSSLLETSISSNFDAHEKVKGTKFSDNGFDWSVEASHRSLMAIFLVPFTMVWAGGSLSGIYGSQIVKGEFDPGQSLFGIPFLLGSVVLITITLMSVFGRTLISNQDGKALVFMGIGSIGWYRRFDWRNIDRVIETSKGQYNHIALEGSKRMNFAWGLSSKKQYYVANLLRSKLQK